MGGSMKSITVAAIQSAAGGMRLEAIDTVLDGAQQADLIVFPELMHVPYFPVELDERWRESALTWDDDFITGLRALVANRGCFALIPMYLREGDQSFNAAVLFGPDGNPVIGRDYEGSSVVEYRKVHLCDMELYAACFYESAYFAAGERFTVWDTPFGTLGVLICYDRHFSEAWRTMRALGAEIVCVPTASPSGTRPTFVAELQAMALQQGLFVVAANRVGEETLPTSGVTTSFLGQSCIVRADGTVQTIAGTRNSETLTAKLDPNELLRVRSGMPLAEHRRADLYRLEPGRSGV